MDNSIFELVTELCDKHIDKRKCIYESINIQPITKRLRAKAFEVLLTKKHITECTRELKGNTDPICHLLAWQYTLKNHLNQPEKAVTLGRFINELKNNESLNNPVVQNVILFLLHLKGSRPEPEQQSLMHNILDKVNLKHKTSTENTALPYDLYQCHKFQFPKTRPVKDPKCLTIFSVNSFKSEPSLKISLSKKNLKPQEDVLGYSKDYKFKPISVENRIIGSKTDLKRDIVLDEGYGSPVKDSVQGNIWEIVSKLPANDHRTWESLDNIDPKKELPFACESGPKTLNLFQKILNANNMGYKDTIEESIISCNVFIKSVKYMLVGMTSDTFATNSEGLFYLKEGISVEGISNVALISYCNDLLFCGSCYRSLNNLCTPTGYKSNENDGYVFKELTESIKRYLAYYRVAALSFPDSADLLTVHSHMRGLRQQIGALAKVCCVSPAVSAGMQRLRGAQLLDYMYKEIMETVDRNIQLVLYSAFYPCCQIYCSRFLQRWLFEGVLIDPYEEFIIKAETDYTKSRARVYWTRSFSLRHNAVPEFLSDLKLDILQCGKAMNLLKQCNPDAALYTHIMSRSLPLISCCLTPDQSQRLKQEIDCYYVEMSALCGPRISLYHRIRDRYGNEENAALLSLVEKKRALAFKEIELRKQFEAEEKAKLKRKRFEELQEQMKISADQKKKAKDDELKEELMIAEQAAQIEELRSKLVKEESKMIISYYNNLIEAVDKRRNSIQIRKQKLLESSINVLEDFSDSFSMNSISKNKFSDSEVSNLDSESVITVIDVFADAEEELATPEEENKDVVNKNIEEETKVEKEESKIEQTETKTETIKSKTEMTKSKTEMIKSETESKESKIDLKKSKTKTKSQKILDAENANVAMCNQFNENYLQAQKNRAKILNLEFNQKVTPKPSIPTNITRETSNLTDAQRNKLKVLSSEFDHYNDANVNTVASATTSAIKNPDIKIENSLASPGHEDVMNLTHRKKILKLPKPNELVTIYEKQISINDATPMSVDSTPNTEYSTNELPTPSSAKLSLNTDILLDTPSIIDSAILTANSCMTDDGFRYPAIEPKQSMYEHTKLLFAHKKIFNITQNIPKSIRPMRVSKEDVEEIKNGNLKSLLYHSVYIPLEAQMKLVNSEIIKYFVNEQNFLSHLHSLRSYYFLFDGEFARVLTDSLFTKLYESKSPTDLLSCRSLQVIVDGALHASSKIQENGDRLSFIVRNVPRSFDLRSAEVLDCLSMSYKINWPLNVILPYDTIEKYDIVFKYLLKLHHMSWVFQKISYELKNTQKEYGIDETLLLSSPQYHKIQLYRHVMYHFIQTLQNYTLSEVLQTSWDELETNLKSVTTLDQLYTAHVVYIKTIMFRCLLNRKCESIMKVISEIFVTILKFYNSLRSRSWNLREKDIYYTHPNFKKMEYVFSRFEEFTTFVFRVGNKMARVGYQPHLIQMLDMLNVNDYYTNKLK